MKVGAGRAGGTRLGVELAAVAAAYYLSARIGLSLALVDRLVTPLWPATGVAVVALRARGLRVWPAIAIGALAVNVTLVDRPLVAVIIAAGNTLAPVAAAIVLERLGFDPKVSRLRDAVVLVLAALTTMTISASIGTGATTIGAAAAPLADTWWVWWTGDVMGVILVAPTIWVASQVRLDRLDWGRAPEAVITFTALGAVAYATSRAEDGYLFGIVSILVLIAWRFQQAGAAPAGLLASTIVTHAAANSQGVFRDDVLLHQMVTLQLFNSAVALTTFVFAAAVNERRAVLEALYQQEHDLAVALQRGLLPSALPAVPGVDAAARYRPSTRGSDVGGDWYDVTALSSDRVGVAIGDVSGHGVEAAAAMAQVRMTLRAHVVAGLAPVEVLSAVNRTVLSLLPDVIVTTFYGEYDPATRVFTYVNAGHPPPLVVSPSGVATYLRGAQTVPLGVTHDLSAVEETTQIEWGSAIVLYTDGVVERRGEALDEGMSRLRDRATGVTGTAAEIGEVLFAGLPSDAINDDAALLVVRTTSLRGLPLRFERPATPESVTEVRRAISRWLIDNGAPDADTADILVACSEAITNVVRHAYPDQTGVLGVTVSREGDEVVIVIRDHGRWLEREPAALDDTNGRGLLLMEALMDTRVDTGSTGTEVRLRRRLTGWTQLPEPVADG